MKYTMETWIDKTDKGYRLNVNFSDNPFMMTKDFDNELDAVTHDAIIWERELRYSKGISSELKTSDLGFTYTKKAN